MYVYTYIHTQRSPYVTSTIAGDSRDTTAAAAGSASRQHTHTHTPHIQFGMGRCDVWIIADAGTAPSPHGMVILLVCHPVHDSFYTGGTAPVRRFIFRCIPMSHMHDATGGRVHGSHYINSACSRKGHMKSQVGSAMFIKVRLGKVVSPRGQAVVRAN